MFYSPTFGFTPFFFFWRKFNTVIRVASSGYMRFVVCDGGCMYLTIIPIAIVDCGGVLPFVTNERF